MNNWSRFIPYRGSMRVDLGPAHCAQGTFRPHGRVYVAGVPAGASTDAAAMVSNPFTFDEDPLYSARLFVGLNVGDKERWTPQDVVDVVADVRKKQTDRADASFILQEGLWEGSPERSVQVVILNVPELKTTPEKFRQQMGELGEALAQRLQQQLVIGEVQRDGVRVAGITATP